MEADDLNELYANVSAADGIDVIDPLAERDWGQSEFTVADPEGKPADVLEVACGARARIVAPDRVSVPRVSISLRCVRHSGAAADGELESWGRTMRYMMLIYNDETNDTAPGTPEWDQLMVEYGKFGHELERRGVGRQGDPLQPTATATTVRVRDGRTLMTDGPFAETAEQLGGYYILDCKDLDEALELAAMIPSAKNGSIEVRPIQPT